MNESDICLLVKRLARPHSSGGVVVERAALLAEGRDFELIMEWVLAHGGQAEAPSAKDRAGPRGLATSSHTAVPVTAPRRFVLPAHALEEVATVEPNLAATTSGRSSTPSRAAGAP
jgi:hypothetical protein